MKNEKESSKKGKIYYDNRGSTFRPEFKTDPHNKRDLLEILGIVTFGIIIFIVYIIGLINNETQITTFIYFIGIFSLMTYGLVKITIPLTLIFYRIAKKTKNWNFVLQFANHSIFLLGISFGTIGSFFMLDIVPGIDPIAKVILVLAPVGLFLTSLLLYLILSVRLKQPLFIEATEIPTDSVKTKSTILSTSALETNPVEDGYSQRAFFSEFDALSKLIPSINRFKLLFTEYAEFLGKKGAIIDWEITEKSAKLYPRFVLDFSKIRKQHWGMYQLLKNIRKRENLTVVKITYNSPQISIHVAPHDYEILAREVTFHLLCVNVLNKIKQSLLAFLNDELDVAFDILFRKPE